MKVLVTGAAGFIGSSVADALLSRGDAVVGLDSFDEYYDPKLKRANLAGALKDPRFRLVEADIRERARMQELLAAERPAALFHAAARAGVRPSLAEPALYAAVNVEGTLNLLEAARRLDPRPNFVFASSSSVYGAREQVPFRETEPCDRPESPYAATKRAGELLGATWGRLYDLPFTGLRFFTVYGPRQRPEMAIHKFTRLLFRGETIPFYGDGASSRDYTFIDDIVAGVLAALDRPQAYELVNLGGDEPIRLDGLVAALEQATGKKAILDRQPDQPGDVPRTAAEISKARRLYGYAPKTPLAAGLARFVAWYRERFGEGGGAG